MTATQTWGSVQRGVRSVITCDAGPQSQDHRLHPLAESTPAHSVQVLFLSKCLEEFPTWVTTLYRSKRTTGRRSTHSPSSPSEMVNLVVVQCPGDPRLCLQICGTRTRGKIAKEKLRLTQGFSKCSLPPGSISNPWESVGNANDRAPPPTYDSLTPKLWTWDRWSP